jgi:ubiquinone/menaquinone biosynthesis C-methylase UbiE
MTIDRPLKTKLLNIDLIFEKAKIKEGETVGDFGCGKNGYFSFLSAKYVGKKGLVYAVDIIKNNLQILEKEAKEHNLSQIKTVWSDLETFKATKIPENTLDLIFLVNILHEAGKPEEMLKESIRLLKKGSRLVIVDWKKVTTAIGPSVASRLDKEFIINLAKKTGFIKEEEFEAGKYHFGLIFIKA